MGRRLVLPNNMNCRNCPAFEAGGFFTPMSRRCSNCRSFQAYGLNESLGNKCTVDYFAYMFRFYHIHSSAVVPAGTLEDPKFEELWGKPVKLAAGASVATIAGQEKPAVYFPGDVLAIREVLLSNGMQRSCQITATGSTHCWRHDGGRGHSCGAMGGILVRWVQNPLQSTACPD